jgi:hypothetical protein
LLIDSITAKGGDLARYSTIFEGTIEFIRKQKTTHLTMKNQDITAGTNQHANFLARTKKLPPQSHDKHLLY